MSTLTQISTLSRTALDAVINLFFFVFTRALDRNFVEFALDTQTSELVITAREESPSGEVGIYRGVHRMPYQKAVLQSIVPYPLAVEFGYPLTYRQLRQQLTTRHQILIEEGEFAVAAGGEGMVDDDIISVPLLNDYAQFKIYATGDSGRFVKDSYMTLIFLQPNRRIPLRAILDIKSGPVLKPLMGS
jgi:hypothetical protein